MRSSPFIVLIVVGALVVVTAGAALFAYSAVRQLAVEASQIAALPAFDPLQLRPTATPTYPAPTMTPLPTQEVTATAESGEGPQVGESVPVWSDPGRVTILLLGIDQRRGEEGPFRTDTMIVLSLDPVRRSGAMLSIPRDLWVSIPGFRPDRINTANSLGDAYEYPGGGPALAAATVERNLGIHIDHTVRVNFDLFLTAVDAIAPVEVCVEQEIYDDHYPDGSYGTITVHFLPGCQALNAEQLLQYARTRATQGGDFDRAARQQQVIRAIRDRVLSLGGVGALLGQAAALWESARENVQTTLTFEQIVSLAALAQDIPAENITQAVLDAHYVDFQTTASGDQVLRLMPGAALRLVQDVFYPQQYTSEQLQQGAASEQAVLSVVNGTTTQGLAAEARAWLEARGFTVAEVGNATSADFHETIIKDYTGNPYTARLLASLLGIPTTRISPGNDNATVQDIQIVVGEDLLPLLRPG